MEIPVIHVFTHDSIGVGEDGPTHQPVEQLASLRAMPGLLVFRAGALGGCRRRNERWAIHDSSACSYSPRTNDDE